MERRLKKINFLVEEKIFEKEETSYAVLKGSNNGIFFIAVGPLFGVDEGETLTLIGDYVENKIYGKQFKVFKFKRQLPSTEKSIIKFLAASKIHGLKEKTAEKIVEKFGKESLSVLEKNPLKLCEIFGISRMRAEKIGKDFKNFIELKNLNIFLQNFKVSNFVCLKIWQKWGVFSLEKVRRNPYILTSPEFGVNFSTAEKIALELEIEKDDEKRIFAAMQFILNHNALENGHCCVPKKSLVKLVCSFLKLEEKLVEEVLLKSISLGKISSHVKKDSTKTKEFIFLNSYYLAERFIAQKLIELKELTEQFNEKEILNLIDLEEKEQNISFSKEQKLAIEKALENKIFILTGGPGTGKTTILNAVISILEKTGFSVCVCAPTGKAAKRLEEVTKKKAVTIHRLLGVQQRGERETEFVHNEKNKLKVDVVIVDEFSMVDCMLFLALLKALKKNCRLILAGDFNQLPCILAGNILKNIVDSKTLPYLHLNKIFRQAQKSLIVANAHNIMNEKPLILNEKGKDFFLIERNTPLEIVNAMINLIKTKFNKNLNLKKDLQIICPCKRGIVGTIEINKRLQNVMNPIGSLKEEFSFGFYSFKEGDKLLQIKNNYDILWEKENEKGEGIFNGEIGEILKINKKEKKFTMNFDGKIAVLDFTMAKDLEPAWAITVHKSQGSEFPIVLMPIFFKEGEFFSKNLLYTAVTRAKKLLILIGVKEKLIKMSKQKKVNFRYSALKEFLMCETDEN